MDGLDWKKYEKVLTIEDHVLPGGFGSAVLEYLSDRQILVPVERLGLSFPEKLTTGTGDYLRKTQGLDDVTLASKIVRVLDSMKAQRP